MQRFPAAKPQRALQRAVSRGAAALPDPLPPQPPEMRQPERADDRTDVPFALRVAASWSWRLGLVIVVGGALIYLLTRISLLVIPLMIAGLVAALLLPVKTALRRRRVPNGLAVAITLLACRETLVARAAVPMPCARAAVDVDMAQLLSCTPAARNGYEVRGILLAENLQRLFDLAQLNRAVGGKQSALRVLLGKVL